MSKAILKTLKPETIINILNGKQSILVTKSFPKDYVGWIYMYCSKGDRLVLSIDRNIAIDNEHYAYGDKDLNDKVFARFWCDKVEVILNDFNTKYNVAVCSTASLFNYEILEKSGLQQNQLTNYLKDKNGYAIHFSIIEIFYKPKELYEFKLPEECWYDDHNMCKQDKCPYFWAENYGECHETGCQKYDGVATVRKAPSNYCYVEVEE